MASLSLSGGEEEFGWRITGLGSAFNQANGYVEAGITKYQFTHSSSSISGVVDSVRAPASGGSTSTARRWVGYDPGTYDFWGYTRVKDGTYWPAGSDTVTVDSPAAQRPDDWGWSSVIRAGCGSPPMSGTSSATESTISDFMWDYRSTGPLNGPIPETRLPLKSWSTRSTRSGRWTRPSLPPAPRPGAT